MPNYARQDAATSNVLAWTAHAANAIDEDTSADADEPPDQRRQNITVAAQQAVSDACHFQKTTVQRPRERTESLLTRALQSQSEDETVDHGSSSGLYPRRRRSITSNTSLASTAGFTSDTGITTPPRTNSPSPRANLGFAPVHTSQRDSKDAIPAVSHTKVDATPKQLSQNANKTDIESSAVPQIQAPQRKRCISFACAPVKSTQQDSAKTSDRDTKQASSIAVATAGPDVTPKPAYAQLAKPTQPAQPAQPTPSAQSTQPKRSCIRFVCPARPSADKLKSDGQNCQKLARKPSPAPEPRSPTSVRKLQRGSSSGRSPRSVTRSSASRQPSHSPLATRSKKYYNAGPEDLDGESSRFHEFASDAPLEEDWIRRDKAAILRRLTINDTLEKELAIRRLGKEAEEEAEEEEQEEEDEEEDEENDDEDDEDDEIEENDEDNDEDGDENDTVEGDDDHQLYDGRFSGYSSGEDASDGYNTDNEVGFASSDDEDDGLVLWTMNHSTRVRRQQNHDNDHSTLYQGGTPVFRRLSIDEHSDSSVFIAGQAMRQERPKNRELASTIRRAATPELPDSTDFVCGTFDEDRPLEEAYLSHIEARKRGKLLVIPQDIDPSFPTSDPEEGSDDESAAYKQRMQRHQQQHGSADDRFWELDDIHHDHQERRDKSKKKKGESPRRHHSPPPPKARGRSPAPRQLFAGKRMRSPAPKAVPILVTSPPQALIHSPHASPVDVPGGAAQPGFLAFRPGLTQTKSLPRPSAIFRHQQHPQNLQAPPQPHHSNQAQAKSYRRPKANSTASVKQPRHVRGAIDIVKGLEQKRQRRKEKFHQKYCNRARKGQVPERRPQRGEGAERMREIGLLMAGKIIPGNYVLSV